MKTFKLYIDGQFYKAFKTARAAKMVVTKMQNSGQEWAQIAAFEIKEVE